MEAKLSTFLRILIIFVLATILFLPGITRIPITDQDEPYFAQATKQMLETSDYFSVKFQDITRYQKPPGINWLQALSNKMFSAPPYTTIWPYRIPSFLGGLFSMLFTFLFTRQWTNDKTAFLATIILGTSAFVVIQSHLCLIDSCLLAIIVLQQSALASIFFKEKSGWLAATLFWVSLSIGIALKGVTPLVAGLTIIALCWISHDKS